MKDFVTFLWKNGIIPSKGFTTTAGEPVEIITPGRETPDGTFIDAKLSVNGEPHNGNIRLHLHTDTCEIIFTTSSGKEHRLGISTNTLQEAANEYKEIKSGRLAIPCERIAATYSNIKLRDYLTRLLVERIEEKAARITQIYESCEKRWNDTLFKLLARSFGFGIQGRAFEEWAMLLNLQALGKHRDNITQVEAIMFGQAGLLAPESIPAYYQESAMSSEYFGHLTREYKFLKSKFNLQEMRHSSWGYGNSSPHIRIARLATLFHEEKLGTTTIAQCKTLEELRGTLQAQPGDYWQHHTQFGSTTTSGTACLTNKQLDVLIINTIVPILYSYGKHRQDTNLCNKAEDYLYEISAENNSIIRRWTQQGLCINSAADSQALIQLNNAYCKTHRCTECRFAHAYFKEKTSNP